MATFTQMNSNKQQLDPAFAFNDIALLSTEPMTDEEFSIYVRSTNNEVPIEEVDFTDLRGM